jgi:hypothetical protein
VRSAYWLNIDPTGMVEAGQALEIVASFLYVTVKPEVEAAWQAEFKRIHDTEAFDSGVDDPMAAFRWSGDQAEVQRLQEEHTHHVSSVDIRWRFRCCDRQRYRRLAEHRTARLTTRSATQF